MTLHSSPAPRSARVRRVVLGVALGKARYLIFVLLAAVIAIRFAEPIGDGDLFWHLAYARQMLERGTLIPDASLYSWTPASTAMIYCAWLSELILQAWWSVGGVAAIAVLRYCAVLGIVALLWHHAGRFGASRGALVGVLLLLVVLAAAPVTLVKPELFSVVFTHLLLWLYFGALAADRAGRDATRWLWAIPLLVLIWINSHGGVILAAPLVAAMLLGDLLNRRFAPRLAFTTRARRTLWLAAFASALATLVTPYGIAYPRQLVADYVLGATARPDAAWNNAHQSPFGDAGWALHLPEYGAAMLALFAWLVWRRRRAGEAVDASCVLLMLVACGLYALYLRSTYLLPAVFGYVAFSMMPARGSARRTVHSARIIAALALVAAIALSARTAWEAINRPAASSWAGFGIGTINPVEEAEWLARQPLGARLYNIFDSGGYLLWRLHPRYQVMVDSRAFPYLAWFDEQYRFSIGERFDSFLGKYAGDVAVIDLAKANAVRNFLRSGQWRPVFVGATAAIFVRRDDERARAIGYSTAPGLKAMRNGQTALRVFDFAIDAGDWETALDLVLQLHGSLAGQLDARVLAAVAAHRQAYLLAKDGKYAEASAQLNRALARRFETDRDRAMLVMLQALAVLEDHGTPQARQIVAGLEKLLEQRR